MGKFFDWVKKHIVTTWAVMSVILAVVIHVTFSVPAPTAWLVAKWSAGDILTYIGTVSLGLLAVWQNNRFKEENDISQQRLERLTVQANELTAINKIIEVESTRLNRLRKAFDDFSAVCDPQTLTTIYANTVESPNAALEIMVATVAAERKIDESFFVLSRELRLDNDLRINDNSPLKIALANYYNAAKDFVVEIKNSPTKIHSELVPMLTEVRNKFISPRELYLSYKEKTLNKVIYGNLSLQEVKSLYCNEK